MSFRILAVMVLLWLPSLAAAQKDLRVFVFGNSLIHHLTESDETAVPHWLALLARQGGHGLELDGRWGFLRDFARELPPEPNWSFGQVERTSLGRMGFRRVGFDTIVINPANFIQYQPADAPYDGDNPTGDSPLAATQRIIDWTENQAPGARFYIYEGWADMGGITRFPPNNRGFRRYQAFNAGEYHDWYVDYVAALQAARPDLSVTLIPVASVLAELLTGVLAEMEPEELYTDDAPHGTASKYFLAALVTYSVLYAEPPPADFPLPESLSPVLRAAYPEVVRAVWAAVGGAVLPEEEAQLLVPETGLADPSLSFGLNGIADWSTQVPFIDHMKAARAWVGHEPGQWGAWDAARLEAGGYLREDGWPRAVPEGVEALETFLLTDQPVEATSLAGRYVVRWRGAGDFTLGGIARDVTPLGDRALAFDYRPGEGSVVLRIAATDAEDPIRDVTVVREDQLALHEVGAVFNPDWIARIRDARTVRFMDWMFTNHSALSRWEDRPRVGDFSWTWRGVPVEVMVDLANEIGADPWFTMPHLADDGHVRAFAAYVHGHLDPRLVAHVEWSNEVWNFGFGQAHWAAEQARARWGDAAEDGGWMQFAGLRAAEVADIWAAEYGTEDAHRLVRVVATHTGWLGLEEALLMAPLAVAEGRRPPVESFDAFAVTGYFGFEIGSDEMAPRLRDWIAEGVAEERVTGALREGSLRELTDVLWPHHAEVARRHGLDLVMYEGGTHVAGQGAQVADEGLTAFFTAYNYSPEMARIYADLMTRWRDLGGLGFNAFVDVAIPSQFGSWGGLRHLDDLNPRWETLMAFNAVPFGAERAEGAFLHGVLRRGTDGADEIIGTPEEDTILAGPGDDVIRAGGGADRIHGGPGTDRAILAGADADYAMAWEGETLVLYGASGATRLFAVEELVFEADPATVQSLVLPEPQL